MRASYLRWNRSSTASNVTFELGFSLAGPSAHNIEKYSDESDRIRAHNDGDLGTTPAVNYSDFGELDIWEPIEQAIDSIGEEREAASDSPAVSTSVPTKGDKKQEGGEQLVSGADQCASKAGKGVSDLSAALDASDELLATIKLEGRNRIMSTNDSQQLFVGNLPHDCTEDHLTELFGKFGKVTDVRINQKQGRDNQVARGGKAPQFVSFHYCNLHSDPSK